LQKNHSALSGQQTSQRPIKQFEAWRRSGLDGILPCGLQDLPILGGLGEDLACKVSDWAEQRD
jgi:hypothetical protein